MSVMNRQIELQKQAVDSAEDVQFFLRDLKQWEAQIKAKDRELRQQQDGVGNEEKECKVPVRGQRDTKDPGNEKPQKEKKKKKKEEEENAAKDPKSRLSSYDYEAWEKFDAEKALEEVSTEESAESDEDEDTLILRAKQQAIIEKDKGNAFLKEGKLDEAINCYTNGQHLDSFNPLLPANRALALLKKQQYGAAEADCNLALAIDPNYVKAHQRRAAARIALKKFGLAKEDLLAALRLEPNNKEAKTELAKVNQALAKSAETTIAKVEEMKEGERIQISPVQKPEHLKSQKPLRRIKIREIPEKPDMGIDGQSEKVQPLALVQSSDQAECCRTTPPPPELPKAPTSSYQFQADFRRLKSHPELLYQYIKQIPSSSYSQLFQHNLEPDILSQMLLLFRDYYMWNGDDLYEPLWNLTQTKRFSALKMFLTDKDKTVLREMFKHMDTVHYRPVEELRSLMQMYEL